MSQQRVPPLRLAIERQVGADGRSVHVLRTLLDESRNGDTDVLVAPGFGQTSRQSAPTACYLAANGIECVRYDGLDHPGLSDGSIVDFTMTAALNSMATALDACARQRCVVVASSISARAAFRLAATESRIVGVVAIVGVVHLRSTLRRVLGVDHASTPLHELPPTYIILGHKIGAHRFAADAHEKDWMSAERTIHDLVSSTARATNVVGDNDDWVDRDEAEWVMCRGGGTVAVLADTTHLIAADWSAVRTILDHSTAICAEWVAAAPPGTAVRRPSFADIATQTVAERGLERRPRADLASRRALSGR
jgi:pimeloyl-ACP methyl ester carboxylesterase